MASPSQPAHCQTAAVVKTQSPGADPALGGISSTLGRLQAEVAQSNCAYTNVAAPLLKSKPIDDAALDPKDKIVYKPKPISNSKKFLNFVKEWGNKAVLSGLIAPSFFDSYKFILGMPPPADNISKTDFNNYMGNTAYIIKTWYVNAQYAGDLVALSLAIDKSIPDYTPPEEGFIGQMCSGSRVFSLKQAAIFAGIVGAGLTSIWLWNVIAGGRRRA